MKLETCAPTMPTATWRTSPDIPAPPPQNGFSLISNQKLFDLYTAMVRSRLIGNRARQQLKKENLSASRIPPKGREAALVGVAFDLRPQDTLAPALWRHAPYSVINPAVRVAADLPRALEAAQKNKASKNNRIAVLFSTAASPVSPAWLRILHSVSGERLPVLLVSWTPSKPAARHIPTAPVPGLKFPTINVDGSDVIAVYRVASEAIVHARKGNGPTLIECIQTPSTDPLKNMENYLTGKGLLVPGTRRKLLAALRSELDLNLPPEQPGLPSMHTL